MLDGTNCGVVVNTCPIVLPFQIWTKGRAKLAWEKGVKKWKRKERGALIWVLNLGTVSLLLRLSCIEGLITDFLFAQSPSQNRPQGRIRYMSFESYGMRYIFIILRLIYHYRLTLHITPSRVCVRHDERRYVHQLIWTQLLLPLVCLPVSQRDCYQVTHVVGCFAASASLPYIARLQCILRYETSVCFQP